MIVAESLSKSFPVKGGPPVEAVRGIDLQVARGESFGFLGPERRREVLHHADDRLRVPADRAAGCRILGLDPEVDGVADPRPARVSSRSRTTWTRN